ncbi:rab-GTPase-TBC domain-containing protein [Pholiota molesta]|nr:rab-GTPase-TBC domain-containing protein [Pholiota molesta]
MLSEERRPNAETKLHPPPLDWNALRAKSLRRGGFGDERVDIWPQVLNVSIPKAVKDEKLPFDESFESLPHVDERQISLDTDRSFVLYPVEPKIDRETLQTGLNQLLVSLFRKRPRLSYFQGYHDIVTVLFLTLPEDLHLPCVEKLSLHRLRDSMGLGLEPILGLLRVTKNLLELADPEYAEILEQSSPLPFYALSNLLTLFSHDMPTLPLIQHVFDYLLCRPPIATVYLATAIILARKKEVIRLQEEDEEGMIHSLLSSLPDLVDDSVDMREDDGDTSILENGDNTFFKEEDVSSPPDISTVPMGLEDVKREQIDSAAPTIAERKPSNDHQDLPEFLEFDFGVGAASTPNPAIPSAERQEISVDPEGEQNTHLDAIKSEISPDVESAPKVEEADIPLHAAPTHPNLTLVDLLRTADELYEQFPPSHSGLKLASIMGPQSVIYTWSESPSALPSDHTAEAMVAHPELIVYPYVEPTYDQKELGAGDAPEKGGRSARRKRRKLRKSPFGQVEKKTMLAGTVIVLGVAMAVYGLRARQAPGGHGLFHYAEGHAHAGVGGSGGGSGGGLAARLRGCRGRLCMGCCLLEFALEDAAAVKLVFSFLDRTQGQLRWSSPRAVGEARESGGIGGRELPYGVKT